MYHGVRPVIQYRLALPTSNWSRRGGLNDVHHLRNCRPFLAAIAQDSSSRECNVTAKCGNFARTIVDSFNSDEITCDSTPAVRGYNDAMLRLSYNNDGAGVYVVRSCCNLRQTQEKKNNNCFGCSIEAGMSVRFHFSDLKRCCHRDCVFPTVFVGREGDAEFTEGFFKMISFSDLLSARSAPLRLATRNPDVPNIQRGWSRVSHWPVS